MNKKTIKLIGLTGYAGAGKDSVADILVAEHGYLKFSFSDALYREVSEAFGVTEEFLKDRETKERPTEAMRLEICRDPYFVQAVLLHENKLVEDFTESLLIPRSPREVLQLWGTEYRRAQDPDYWVKRSQEFAAQQSQPLVNTSVRFDNEAAWISAEGEVWCVRRPGRSAVNAHPSEAEQPFTRLISNHGTLADLSDAVKEALQ